MKLIGSGTTKKVKVNVNEILAQEFHKPVIKKRSKKGKCMRGLNIKFGQQIWLKWDHYPLKIKVLKIYYVS